MYQRELQEYRGKKHRFSLSIGNGRYILLERYRAHRFCLNPVLQPIVDPHIALTKCITASKSSTEMNGERVYISDNFGASDLSSAELAKS